MKAKLFLFSLALFFSLTVYNGLFGQITGPNTQFYLSRYNFVLGVGKSPVVLGDTLGIMGFRGLLSSGDYQRSAGIYAVVTNAPTATGLASRLTFATGANGLQDRMTILENGFVGINTNAPAYRLHVNGDAFISGDFTVGGNFKVLGDIQAGRDVKAGRDVLADRNVEAKVDVKAAQDVLAERNVEAKKNIKAGDDLTIENDLFVKNGRVGIGVDPNNPATTPGTHKLYVGGSIIAEEVKVQLRGAWPDYVFDTAYTLPSLTQVDLFIQTHKHLPNIPSAKELAQNGLPLGEMQQLMMEKVEELYLHVINLEKQIKVLQAENEILKKNSHK
jgi:hypothetical protein